MHESENTIGSKSWFAKDWNDINSDEKEAMRRYYQKCKIDAPEEKIEEQREKEEVEEQIDGEINFSHSIYHSVKVDCSQAVLHRKNERLEKMGELDKLFSNAFFDCLRYFINNLNNFSHAIQSNNNENPITLENAQNIVHNSVENIPKDSEQYFNAMCQIFMYVIDREMINKIVKNHNRAEKDVNDLLNEICSTADMIDLVINWLTQVMSAHLVFHYDFPSGWLKLNQLNPISSTNPVLDGRVYQPDDYHCWIVNLSWMLAHLHKGHEFIISSEVSLDNMKRKTEGHEGELSGFAREIALAKKMGYHFENENGNITMRATPDVKERCKQLTFDSAFMDKTEVEEIYYQIMNEFDQNKKEENKKKLETEQVKDSYFQDNMLKAATTESIDSEEQTAPPAKRRKIEEKENDGDMPSLFKRLG
jgi:hypothetical protein